MAEAIVEIFQITEGPDAGKFKITGLPDPPIAGNASTNVQHTGSSSAGVVPPDNGDGTYGPKFETEDAAFETAKSYTAASNLSFCSADLHDGTFAVVRNNAIGRDIKRCQPAVFEGDAAADRDRQGAAQLEVDRSQPGYTRGRHQ